MHGVIGEGEGLVTFLQQVMLQRNNFSSEEKNAALQQALGRMKAAGTVAVGDIANTADTLEPRLAAAMHFHTFIESIGFTDDHAADRFLWPQKIYEQFAGQPSADYLLRQSIVPHAPYSVSPALFGLIDQHKSKSLVSIHNEETLAENEYYREKSGRMKELYDALHIDDAFFTPSGKTSLQTCMPYLSKDHPLILVHNTYMEEQDTDWLQGENREYYLCLCPNANWYIERRMPPIPLFLKKDMNICLGTDSLASNHQLSILAEIQTIKSHFPGIDIETLLRWGTLNGAKALQMEHIIGSLEAGKRPGIILIDEEEQIKVLY